MRSRCGCHRAWLRIAIPGTLLEPGLDTMAERLPALGGLWHMGHYIDEYRIRRKWPYTANLASGKSRQLFPLWEHATT